MRKSKYTEVLEVLNRIVAAGYTIVEVNVNDEDEDNLFVENGEITAKAAYDLILEYDEGYVYIRNDEKKLRFLFFVLGNEPGVALSNYTSNPVIDKISEEVYDLYNQPDSTDKLIELQQEVEKCKDKILSATECFTPESGLFEMICVLISQRDNAYGVAEALNANLQPEDRRF